MKYFFDTEFIEGFHKPLFGKRRHHIDLISIGIVDEFRDKIGNPEMPRTFSAGMGSA